jgi:hypothetical protein
MAPRRTCFSSVRAAVETGRRQFLWLGPLAKGPFKRLR